MPDGVVFRGGNVLTGGRSVGDVDVSVEGSRISAVGAEASRRGRRRARNLARVDLDGAFLAPGFIDLHTHGAAGVQFDHASERELDELLRDHFLAHGVTRLLASLVPAPKRELIAAISRVAAAIRKRVGRGVAAGIHLEGPFLSPDRPGALPAGHFRTYSAALVDALLDAGDGAVRTMTLAPERAGADALIAHLRRRRVIPAFGHSAGGFDDAERAIRAGVRYVTHLFNAMEGIHHRRPGPVSAFLGDPRVRVELISDGFHVDREVMRWLARVKRPEEVCLVSDSVSPCGLRPGTYRFAGRDVRLEGGRVTLSDGTLAGSALTLDRAVRSQVRDAGRLPEEASVSASATPARIAGWHRDRGEIAPGKIADLVVLDRNLAVRETYLAGERVFRRGKG